MFRSMIEIADCNFGTRVQFFGRERACLRPSRYIIEPQCAFLRLVQAESRHLITKG